jgi:hypothetical protein
VALKDSVKQVSMYTVSLCVCLSVCLSVCVSVCVSVLCSCAPVLCLISLLSLSVSLLSLLSLSPLSPLSLLSLLPPYHSPLSPLQLEARVRELEGAGASAVSKRMESAKLIDAVVNGEAVADAEVAGE